MIAQMLCAAMLAAVNSPAVVPAPQEMKVNEGSFSLKAKTLERKDYKYTLDKSLPKEGYRLSVTAGGIAATEMDPTTFAIQRLPGVYAAGEVLDVDGDCGGYNLQFAWSSAYVAAQSIRKNW